MKLSMPTMTRVGLSVLTTVALAWATPSPATAGEQPAQKAAAAKDTGKIPITTKSKAARQAFLKGRSLAEDLLLAEARPHFQEAVELDPDFAFAYLSLAGTAPSAKAFFAAVQKAVEAAEHASPAERHLIRATQAGIKGNPDEQYRHLRSVVEAYPEDERARMQLGIYFMGRQEYEPAIGQLRRATEINREFAPAYNQLGYALRFAGHLEEAATTFRRYIELLPDQPNPYDSYGELLMKMGRFQESIASFRKALAKDPDFVFAYRGIGNNQIFLGQYDAARATLEEFYEKARNDGERRQAMFWTAASYVHEGKSEQAMKVLERRSKIARESGDYATLAGDSGLKGMVQLYAGNLDSARRQFERSVELIQKADVEKEVRAATRRNLHYQLARVALAAGDVAAAKETTAAYAEAVERHRLPFEQRQLHELKGRIALAEGDGERARRELEQASRLDPRVLLALAEACKMAGDAEGAARYASQAADFNALNFNYAFVRPEAQEMVAAIERG